MVLGADEKRLKGTLQDCKALECCNLATLKIVCKLI